MITKAKHDTPEKQHKLELAISYFDHPGRSFIYTDTTLDTYKKKYNYWSPEIKLMKFAADTVGMLSDAYILYAITCLGHCTAESIIDFLGAYVNRYPDLYISDEMNSGRQNNELGINLRIRELVKNGFVYRQSYDVKLRDGRYDTISVYSTDKDSQTFMNQKLGKHVVIRPWTMIKNLYPTIAAASAAFVCGKTCRYTNSLFVKIKEDAMKTTEMGTVLLPPVITLEKEGRKQQVLFYPAFLKRMKSYQTEYDYSAACVNMINEIKNYFYTYKESRHAPADTEVYAVLVVEDTVDLDRLSILIQKTQTLITYGNMESIYITSEGAIRYTPKIKDAFIQIQYTDYGTEICHSEPPFM